MFTRRPDTSPTDQRPPALPVAGRPNPPATQPKGAIASVIGTDLSITGNLDTAGEIRIEGEVQGDIRAARIIIGEQAVVTGALIADEVIISGNVQGSIRGNHVAFQSASHVEGDVYHRSLTIEQGAYFEGKSRRSDDPLSVQYSPSNMPPPSTFNGT